MKFELAYTTKCCAISHTTYSFSEELLERRLIPNIGCDLVPPDPALQKIYPGKGLWTTGDHKINPPGLSLSPIKWEKMICLALSVNLVLLSSVLWQACCYLSLLHEESSVENYFDVLVTSDLQ